MENPPKNFKEAAREIVEHTVRVSEMENWVEGALDDLTENFGELSTMVFSILSCLKQVHGLEESDGFNEDVHPLLLKYLQERKEDYGLDTIARFEKLNKFFADNGN
jgi:hypothetical protein